MVLLLKLNTKSVSNMSADIVFMITLTAYGHDYDFIFRYVGC